MIIWNCPLCNKENFNWKENLDMYVQSCRGCKELFEVHVDWKEIWYIKEVGNIPIKEFKNIEFRILK